MNDNGPSSSSIRIRRSKTGKPIDSKRTQQSQQQSQQSQQSQLQSQLQKQKHFEILKRRKQMIHDINNEENDNDNEEVEHYIKEFNRAHTNFANDMIKSNIMIVAIILIILGIYIYYTKPIIFFPKKNLILLPIRNIITIYPNTIQIQNQLQRFVSNYAIVKPNNIIERTAIRNIAAIRRMITYTSIYNQKIYYKTWEYMNFMQQFHIQRNSSITTMNSSSRTDQYENNNNILETYCGNGYIKLYQTYLYNYENNNNDSSILLNHNHYEHQLYDLMYFCLLHIGHADGYIRWKKIISSNNNNIHSSITNVNNTNTKNIHQHRIMKMEAELTHGIRGVAVIYYNNSYNNQSSMIESSNMNHSNIDLLPLKGGRINMDLLLLPILSYEQLSILAKQQQKQQYQPKQHNMNQTRNQTTIITPSTQIPIEMMKFLLSYEQQQQETTNHHNDYQIHVEEYLYQLIIKENIVHKNWDFLYAVCNNTNERLQWDLLYRRIATDCAIVSTTATTTDTNSTPFKELQQLNHNNNDDDTDSNNNCCSFYDRSLKPISYYRKRSSNIPIIAQT